MSVGLLAGDASLLGERLRLVSVEVSVAVALVLSLQGGVGKGGMTVALRFCAWVSLIMLDSSP